jgi:hypothetical protein
VECYACGGAVFAGVRTSPCVSASSGLTKEEAGRRRGIELASGAR